MEQLRQSQLYKTNRLYKDMPKRTVTGEFFGGRCHCAEPETKPEQEPSFLLTRPEKKYRPKKSLTKIQQAKILSDLVQRKDKIVRRQQEKEERLKRERIKRDNITKYYNQYIDFLRVQKLPATIGDLHKKLWKIVNYRTFQRRIQTLNEQGKITIKKVIGGKRGSTTIILRVNKVRQDAR